jgi:hypothetical protein
MACVKIGRSKIESLELKSKVIGRELFSARIRVNR